jgi:hypothetical protein
MIPLWRRWLAPVVLLGACFLAGCGIGDLAYFLMPETNHAPLCASIIGKDKKKEVKALVLVYAQNVPNRREAMQADRELAELLVKHLREQYQTNEEKVTLIPPRQVEDYKNRHPEWKDLQPIDIGKLMKVDYVIVLDIHSFTLHANGPTMYRGQTSISVSLVDVHKPEEAPEHKEFTCLYPSESKGGIDMDPNEPATQFRGAFLDTLAKRLTRYFAAYPESEDREVD